MSTQNILKGTTIFPTINLQANETGRPSDALDSGSVYNTYKGSFIISVTPPYDAGGGYTYLPIEAETDICYNFPVLPDDSNRNIKTLNLRLIQTGYSTVGSLQPLQSRTANITISTTYDGNDVIKYHTETIDTNQSSESPPYPIDYESCVSYDTTNHRFTFKIVRAAGSYRYLRSIVKGIYKLY